MTVFFFLNKHSAEGGMVCKGPKYHWCIIYRIYCILRDVSPTWFFSWNYLWLVICASILQCWFVTALPSPLEIAVDLKLICHKKYPAMQHSIKSGTSLQGHRRANELHATRPRWRAMALSWISANHGDISPHGSVWKQGIPNYSHLVRIMRINQWIFGYTISDPNDGKK